ncbi:hypothetical protein PVK06_008376 [Gossypium arboreum]|uniref:DUF4283 domain-containing protein n=1 Tax=Gossypium arboreum TaxID=29729 RepID=A0ABR0QL49_GOSAR|nr:hypothetical protein PVK06_008376 [Gossypium arboreum]
MTNLYIDEGEDEAWVLKGGFDSQKPIYEYSLVCCFLTASVVHFSVMRSTMVKLWHPLVGVLISDLCEKRYLFKFYHELDIDRVINGAPWTFNNRLLVFHRMEEVEDLLLVPLDFKGIPLEDIEERKRPRVSIKALNVSTVPDSMVHNDERVSPSHQHISAATVRWADRK